MPNGPRGRMGRVVAMERAERPAAGSTTAAAAGDAGPGRTVIVNLAMPFYPIARPWTRAGLLEAAAVDREAYVAALAREVEGAVPDFADCRVAAVLVGGGGGVAAHMADGRLGALLRTVRQRFDLTAADSVPAEVALTAHPGMVSAATLDACRMGHVTRLVLDYATSSSTEARELGRFMGPEAMEVTRTVLGSTRIDLSFTLLVGIPGQTERSGVASVEAALGYGATAVRLERFSLDPACRLARDRAARDDVWRAQPPHRLPAPDERGAIADAMGERLRAEGFAEYLPGEWALPGHECRYLQLAAAGCETLGFGLGAVTRFGGVYARNTDDWATYLRFSDDPARCIAEVRASE